MKCRAKMVIKAQRKINKINEKSKFLNKEDRQKLYENAKSDKDFLELVRINKKS